MVVGTSRHQGLSSSLLNCYDSELEIILTADASDYGIGAVISNVFPDSTEKEIAHGARTLSEGKTNNGQIGKE